MTITDDFRRALEAMEVGRDHVFITGRAGTGKSTLLNYFRQETRKSIAVVAPTGVAAMNVGGQTLHSFFRFPARAPATLRIRRSDSPELYQKLDALVIDEISMVRVDMVDAIDRFLRLNRQKEAVPFGGVQLILIGDLGQLPPVIGGSEGDFIAQQYGTPFFFGADAIRNRALETIELRHVFRQSDKDFIEALGAIRDGVVDDAHLDLLNARVDESFQPYPDDPIVLLTPTNAVADRENARRMKLLDGQSMSFQALASGKFVDVTEKDRPVPTDLTLKVGAHVMFVRNDRDRRWVNGSLGMIAEMEEDAVRVELADGGPSYWVEAETWEMHEYTHNKSGGTLAASVVGTYSQLPLRLGYALTIHRSQGKTLDRVVVDMSRGAFAPGQTYVALSRVRSLDGLVLIRPITRDDVSIDPAVTRFIREGVVPTAGQGRLL